MNKRKRKRYILYIYIYIYICRWNKRGESALWRKHESKKSEWDIVERAKAQAN